ncbi:MULTISPECIES: YfaP family protein [unclassified Pseudomonas]|uniref:YfaP family protein n=1 Tax=unclassified Pseudomonas TaxID=196821 RepID=UPI0035C26682
MPSSWAESGRAEPGRTEPSVSLQSPTGGWRYYGLNDGDSDARVAYPTPPIDRGAQRGRSLIEGTLKNIGHLRAPHRLVVNGNPLPLYTDEQGSFARPYAFGAGSNSVELVAGEGQSLKRIQFFEANSLRTPARIRMVLGWDDPKAELDLHVVTPDGQHAFWSHPVLSNGGGLDVDSVDGPGPEMFTMTAPLQGTYLVYVNYWGNLGSEGYNFEAGSNQNEIITAQINLIFNENTVNEKRETFVVPLRAIGELLFVKSFNY